jgi:hypothetical protein
MNLDRVFNVAGAIVSLAVVAVIVGSPRTANIIKATGSAFAGTLRAASGR